MYFTAYTSEILTWIVYHQDPRTGAKTLVSRHNSKELAQAHCAYYNAHPMCAHGRRALR